MAADDASKLPIRVRDFYPGNTARFRDLRLPSLIWRLARSLDVFFTLRQIAGLFFTLHQTAGLCFTLRQIGGLFSAQGCSEDHKTNTFTLRQIPFPAVAKSIVPSSENLGTV